MNFFLVLILSLNNYFFFNSPLEDTFLTSDNPNTEEVKEVVNKENKNGMLVALLGSLVIIEIGLIYKKKKIKL